MGGGGESRPRKTKKEKKRRKPRPDAILSEEGTGQTGHAAAAALEATAIKTKG